MPSGDLAKKSNRNPPLSTPASISYLVHEFTHIEKETGRAICITFSIFILCGHLLTRKRSNSVYVHMQGDGKFSISNLRCFHMWWKDEVEVGGEISISNGSWAIIFSLKTFFSLSNGRFNFFPLSADADVNSVRFLTPLSLIQASI